MLALFFQTSITDSSDIPIVSGFPDQVESLSVLHFHINLNIKEGECNAVSDTGSENLENEKAGARGRAEERVR